MKIFETLFSINGKLQPGFTQAFGTAQTQAKNLGKSANDVNKAFAAVGKRLVAIGAAYLGWKGISTFFNEATAAAQRSAAINAKLLNTLKAQKGMQVEGVMNYQNQYNKLVTLSQELGKVGVVSAGQYRTAMATLAAYGMTPNKIQKISESLGNVAVQQHGVNVSSEQMESLAERWSNAIVRGNIRGLGPLVGHMTAAEKAAWKTANEAQRIETLVKAAERAAKDFNQEMAQTPEGKIRTFQNQWSSFLSQVGEQLRPFHGEVAALKSEMLAAFGGPVLEGMKTFGQIFRAQADEFEDWDPELRGLFVEVSDFSAAIGELADAFTKLGAAFGLDWSAGAAGLAKLVGTEVIQAIKDTARAIEVLANAIGAIKGLFDWFTEMDQKIMAIRQKYLPSLGGGAAAPGAGPAEIGRQLQERGGLAAAALPAPTTAEQTEVGRLLRDQVEPLRALENAYNDNLTAQIQATAEYRAGMATAEEVRNANQRVSSSQATLEQALNATGTAAGFSADEIQKLGGGVDAVIQALQQKAAQLTAINIQAPTIAAPVAAAAPMQEGGLVENPTYAMLGEAGAEMVLPLQRSRRALGLLEAAAKRLGIPIPGWIDTAARAGGVEQGHSLGKAMEELFSRLRGNAPSAAARASGPLNYAPTLNFGSGVEPGMVTLARNMLRSTAGEFFDRYEEAWQEDRRLLFE